MDTDALTSLASGLLADAADPGKAAPMAAYMKTDMPFYGVQKKGREPVSRAVRDAFRPTSLTEYVEAIEALWALPHREERYVALAYARAFDRFICVDSMNLYRRLITDGAWWDFVDEAATKLVGRVVKRERDVATPVVRLWISDGDLWLRRTSIVCQLGHKDETDTNLLREACLANTADGDFFIRKAIGWALREYAKTDPDWVRRFVAEHRHALSPLSYREATKHL